MIPAGHPGRDSPATGRVYSTRQQPLLDLGKVPATDRRSLLDPVEHDIPGSVLLALQADSTGVQIATELKHGTLDLASPLRRKVLEAELIDGGFWPVEILRHR